MDRHIPKQVYVLGPNGKIELVPNKQKAEFDVRACIFTPAITHGFSEQMHDRQFTHVFGLPESRRCLVKRLHLGLVWRT